MNKAGDIELTIRDAERLYRAVLRDHREAIADGWPQADEYIDLEAQIRALLVKAQALL